MKNGEILMTTSFVARDVGVSEGTVDNLARSGRLPSIMTTSKRRVFRKSDVDVCKAELRIGDANRGRIQLLARLDLLFAEEKAIFKKHDSIINVSVQQGERGKCVPCWDRAREIVKKIDFDLDGAMRRYEFWIAGDLYITCEHWQCNGACGIFVDAD